MLKTLRMGEFNQFLQEGKTYLKSFPGAKQLNHHTTAVLNMHSVTNGSVTNSGINAKFSNEINNDEFLD